MHNFSRIVVLFCVIQMAFGLKDAQRRGHSADMLFSRRGSAKMVFSCKDVQPRGRFQPRRRSVDRAFNQTYSAEKAFSPDEAQLVSLSISPFFSPLVRPLAIPLVNPLASQFLDPLISS